MMAAEHPSSLATPPLATRAELARLEAEVQHALETGDQSALEVIGFGEISTVLRARTSRTTVACKRTLPYATESAARHAMDVMRRYVSELERHGVDVVETELHALPCKNGTFAVYCVQPELPADTLGVAVFGRLASEEAAVAFRRILETLKGAVTSELAPDGQLSNWAFAGERLVYLDVTSPFLRDETGKHAFDFEHTLAALPSPVSRLAARFVLESTLESYYSLRGQALDFLGNLEKEHLGRLIDPLIPIANDALDLDKPIERRHVDAYYRADARTYALLQWACRAKCWTRHTVLRLPYPYLPKPPIKRYG